MTEQIILHIPHAGLELPARYLSALHCSKRIYLEKSCWRKRRNRTFDALVFSQALYHLSYLAVFGCMGGIRTLSLAGMNRLRRPCATMQGYLGCRNGFEPSPSWFTAKRSHLPELPTPHLPHVKTRKAPCPDAFLVFT